MTHSTRYECTNDEVRATNIPNRVWYSIAEAAQLTGMSEEYLRQGIRKGQRRHPPADAITCVRKFGTQWRIHRSYIYPDEPANVTPLHGGMTDAQLDAAFDRFLASLLSRITGQPIQQKRSA